jgi:Undecaprenyl-phosphate galactose phosphotransferase WbaP
MIQNNISSDKYKITYNPNLVIIILVIFDIVSNIISFIISLYLRSFLNPIFGVINIESVFPMLWINIIVIFLLFSNERMYPGKGKTGVIELKKIFSVVGGSFLAILIFTYSWNSIIDISRLFFVTYWLLSTILIASTRLFLHNRGSLLDWWNEPIIIIGDYENSKDIVDKLKISRRMAYKPIVCLITDQKFISSLYNGVKFIKYSDQAQLDFKKFGIKTALIIDHSFFNNNFKNKQLLKSRLIFSTILIVMENSPISSLSLKSIDIEGRPAFKAQYNLLNPWTLKIKRYSDIIICLFTFFFSVPLFILISLLIRINTPGPILFVQYRMGKNGKLFKLIKFRTMHENSENILKLLLKNDKKSRLEYEKYHKLINDPRITPIGRFLRKSSLDELPQLWNVIKGDMALVGPRAYMPNEKEKMGGSEDIIFQVSPGLTGWWQVMGRHNTTFQERLELDKYYISNFSTWLDFYILIKTVAVVIGGKGT